MTSYKLLLLAINAIAGATMPLRAQVRELPEVTVTAKNYKYLRSINSKEAAQPVKLLEAKAASYDIKNSEYYEDDNDTYFITFYLPEGYVLAVYDQEGKLLRTAEKFKNIVLPALVRASVAKRFPNWSISKDIYLVKFGDEAGAKMQYKLLLENGSKRMRVKTDENGEFID
ncbi:nicotinate-nucleotide adenylyltransferase [Chitinophaga pollutisoli]|uniref:Nicotinate-nucleotide adenylyltransferase n=1 Tax=Chitinophaga pollutisoli TaxID=3133966 RepID=A0ABZ2YNF9_9BACT